MPRPTITWHPDYEVDIGRHVFPTAKFRLAKELLVSRGVVAESEVLVPPPATDAELLAALAPEYLADLRTYRHTRRTLRSELPMTRPIVEAMVTTAGGTLQAARSALDRGAACHVGGGYHHAFADHAEGFCYINDVAVAIEVLRREGRVRRVAVVDTDVHQGNGTAGIFAGNAEVFTYSIHEERIYPFPKTVASDLDIGLEAHPGRAKYLQELSRGLDLALDAHRPELVFYVSGVDPFENDQLGNLGLSWDAMRERDEVVLSRCAKLGVPFVTVVAGGYSRNLAETVGLHAQTVEVAIAVADGMK